MGKDMKGKVRETGQKGREEGKGVKGKRRMGKGKKGMGGEGRKEILLIFN